MIKRKAPVDYETVFDATLGGYVTRHIKEEPQAGWIDSLRKILRAIAYVAVLFTLAFCGFMAIDTIWLGYERVIYSVGSLLAAIFCFRLTSAVWFIGLGELTWLQAIRDEGWLSLLAIPALLLLLTDPKQREVDSTFVIQGKTDPMSDLSDSEFYIAHCREDALDIARRVYGNRASWARDDEGKFVTCDVEIIEEIA